MSGSEAKALCSKSVFGLTRYAKKRQNAAPFSRNFIDTV